MKNQAKDPYPVLLERDLFRRFPELEEAIAIERSVRETDPWPDWCYLPMAGSYAIASNGAEIPLALRYIANQGLNDYYLLSSIIPWRYGKPIYHFDNSLAESLMQTEADEDEVPVSVIQRLPYPGLFIDSAPGIEDCLGIFVFLEYDYRYPDVVELRMHYLFVDEIVPLYLQWTRDRDTLNTKMLKDNMKTYRDLGGVINQRFNKYEECFDLLPRHLNLVLYLCSDEPDLSRSAPKPRIRSHKGAPATAAYPDRVEVGVYVGSVLRKSETQTLNGSGSGVGSSKRPHARRAHWHLYWTGEGRKVPAVKWIMPVFIHADKGKGTAIHPVK